VLKDQIIGIYSKQPDVVALMNQAWLAILIFVFFDGMQYMGGAALRGSGKQGYGALVTTCAYWFIGLPLAFVFAFKCGLELRGLWYGPLLACAFNFFAYNVILICMDFDKVVEEIAERREKERKIK
jgi:multidrug resistance protein, MATE family